MTAVGRATAEAMTLGAAGGLISVWILLRRLPFFTLAMTHATFPGVVLAAVAGVDLYAGGGLFGVVVVMGVVLLSRRRDHDASTATGIALSAGFALGVVLLSARDGFSKDLSAYTVGQIFTVGDGDLVAVGVAGLLVVALLGVAHRRLAFRAFDPDGYAAAGHRTAALDVALLLAVEAVVVVAMPAAGAILSVAVLVAPAAIARLWSDRVPVMTAVAVVTGTGSGLAGVQASARYDVAAGGAITLVLGAVFALSLVAAGVSRRLSRGRLRPVRPPRP